MTVPPPPAHGSSRGRLVEVRVDMLLGKMSYNFADDRYDWQCRQLRILELEKYM